MHGAGFLNLLLLSFLKMAGAMAELGKSLTDISRFVQEAAKDMGLLLIIVVLLYR